MQPVIADLRHDVRSRTLLAATLEVGPLRVPVQIRNISSSGALIATPTFLHVGRTVILTYEDLAVAGQVAWTKDRVVGVSFSEQIDDSKWRRDKSPTPLSNPPVPHPQINHTDKLHLAGTVDIEEDLKFRISEEANLIARTIELVSEIIVADPILRQRYSQILQEMSQAQERLEQIAQIVQAGSTRSSVERLASWPLRARLLREKNF
jgi:hypothetical protein